MTAAITWSNLREALLEVDAWVDAYPAETVLALWEAQAWKMLDYPSWEALCDARGWTKRVALPRPERREVVATLRQEGMSTRAIAAATGVSYDTVQRDLRSEGDRNLSPVVGTDGKTYQPTQPAPRAGTVQPAHDELVSVEPEGVDPVPADDTPVEVLTSEEWMQREGINQEDLIPADLQFQRRFWGHMKATHELLMDMDFPHYFDAAMAERLADFVATVTAKHEQFAKSQRGLRVVQGGKA